MAVLKVKELLCLAIIVIEQSHSQSWEEPLKMLSSSNVPLKNEPFKYGPMKNVPLKRVSLRKTILECVDSTHVRPDSVLKLRMGIWDQKDEVLKQWALCLLVRSQLMSREGVFKLDNALKRIPREDMVEKIIKINSCLPTKRTTPREIAWKYLQCYNAENPTGLIVL